MRRLLIRRTAAGASRPPAVDAAARPTGASTASRPEEAWSGEPLGGLQLHEVPVDSTSDAWDELHAIVGSDPGITGTVEGVVVAGEPLGLAVMSARRPTGPWARRAVRLPDDLDQPRSSPAVIGHADTGWAAHPAVLQERWRLSDAFSAFDGGSDARDPLRSYDPFDGHGTGTASVLVGRPGPGGDHASVDGIEAIAPSSTIVPARCANGVVLFSDVLLSAALDHFAELDSVDVVTISLGGVPSPTLLRAVRRLVFRSNAVVVAAAGQRFPACPYPAAYDDCIAVAATTANDRPWRYTTASSRVDISAPGHGVCVADFRGSSRTPIVRRGSGTSYAVPHVAGAAALWIEHHGRAHLRARYRDGQPLHQVFRQILHETARRPDPLPPAQEDDAALVNFVRPMTRWRTDRFGAGIVDIGAILSAPLPPPTRGVSAASADPPDDADHWMDVVAHVLELSGREQAVSVVERLGLLDRDRATLLTAELATSLLRTEPTSLAALQIAAGGRRDELGVALRDVVAPTASRHLRSAIQR